MRADQAMPRPEYPRPQFVRDEWLCLNGEWEFEIDAGDSGLSRGLLTGRLKGRIRVPFCPESELSGIGHTDFMNAVWYRRSVTLPEGFRGKRVLLHFQAVDYDATVWVNGHEVARHRGGFTPFTCDLAGLTEPGKPVSIVVRARDPHRGPQPRGKQSSEYGNAGCLYTRTTGIWQTVWLEPVPDCYLQRPRITPDVARRRFCLELPVSGARMGKVAQVRLRDPEGVVAEASVALDRDLCPTLDLEIPPLRERLWSPADPFLYDLDLEIHDATGELVDRARSYAGLRSVVLEGKKFLLNGQPLFQRLVLDQGYYPYGILTAPSDEALCKDIELALAAGFNGARLHQKVFEERFLYHADRLGYLVWGEFADWGSQGNGPAEDHQRFGPTYLTQWLEALERDYSHPCIIGWCALNETGQPLTDRITELDDVTLGLFLAAKALDRTRPVLDASGYAHRVRQSDVYDAHDYDQNPETFRGRHDALKEGQPLVNEVVQAEQSRAQSIPYRGQPYFVSEFGGIWWNPEVRPGEDSWGYGDRPKTLEGFHSRFQGLCRALLDNPDMFGYCYTQLTDVFQEQNGILTFERRPKFDLERLRAVQSGPAAIERRRPGG